jgi:outer membrane protein TolC
MHVTDYSKARSYFPNPIAPYMPRKIEPAFFGNSPRIEQIYKDGKILLSLDDAIALALENNLDIAIARYNLSIADTDILLAKAGQAIRGVATGVVQGTPGGGVGGFGTGAQGAGAGGTTTAAGGAGTGTSGLVQSTLGSGPAVEQFDPAIAGTFSVEHGTFPEANTVFTGVPTLNQNTTTGNFTYTQGWATGTDMNLAFDNSRQSTNSLFSAFNPVVNSAFRLTVRQHLLQGFGILNNRRFIVIAQNDRKIADAAFRQQIETTVPQIENIYWDLVSAYENVQVQQSSLALAQKTLSDNQKQVQIGTLAPIEVVRAQSAVASAQQALIVAQTNLELQQSLTKNALLRSIPPNSPLAEAQVIPTDTMQLPTNEVTPPIPNLVQLALQNRPEIPQSEIDLTNRKITEKSTRNGLLPTVDLFGFYGASGLAGNTNPALLCGNPGAPAPPRCIPAPPIDTGLNSAFHNLFNSSAPDKGMGVNILIPIRNRAAQADYTRSVLEYRQAEMRLLQLKNQIGIDVRNAAFALEQNRAQVVAAQEAERLAAESLDAEQKKYQLGASTSTLVLQQQSALATAQSNLVTAKAAYEKSRVELDRVTGQTLAHNNIVLPEAEAGVLNTPVSAPFVVTRPDANQPPTLGPAPAVTPQTQPAPEQPNPQQPPAQEQTPPPGN